MARGGGVAIERVAIGEVARYVVAGLIAATALLVAASLASMIGWQVGDGTEQRGWHRVIDGAWSLLYSVGIGLAGLAVARLVLRRNPWSWWLLLAFVFPTHVILVESGTLGQDEVVTWGVRLLLAGAYVGFLVWLYLAELPHWRREHGEDGRPRLRWAVILAPVYVLFLYETRHRRRARQPSEPRNSPSMRRRPEHDKGVR